MNEEAGSRVVETWFKAVVFSHWDTGTKTAYLTVPNMFVKEWVESNYLDLVKLHLGRLLYETNIKILLIEQASDLKITPAISLQSPIMARTEYVPSLTSDSPHITPSFSLAAKKTTMVVKNTNITKSQINSTYQFDTFVVGPNNSLAYAASQAAANKPGHLYNPLFIYGDSGLGKTHLLHAIGNHIRAHFPKARILYQSADRFLQDFIQAIRFDKITAFENKYKEIDVLLVDDIQFLSNKEQTQEAFFHIFNALYEAKKQIVFSSDSLPKDIEGLADRLRSRLDGGLVTDIQSPTLETRVAILKKKAELHQECLTDEVAYYIAARAVNNIRELEGLLIRVFAYASLTGQPVSMEAAQKVLGRLQESEKPQNIDLQLIAQKVAHHYHYTINELRSSKRLKNISLARHVAMYLMKKHTEFSLSDIGTFWHRKDHSTVIHALEKIEQLRSQDTHFHQELEKLENKLSGH